MTVQLAVSGTSLMGSNHARIVAEDLPGARLQVVRDTDGTRTRSVADACGAADVGDDPETLIARADVDALIIASPDFTHAPLSRVCIRAGKRVLCERPLLQSSAECLAVMRAELVGEKDSIAMNPVAYTRSDRALASATAYDADWRGRYAAVYPRQNRAFLRFVEAGMFPAIAASAWDGYAAAIAAEAGVRALTEGRKLAVEMASRPELYALKRSKTGNPESQAF